MGPRVVSNRFGALSLPAKRNIDGLNRALGERIRPQGYVRPTKDATRTE